MKALNITEKIFRENAPKYKKEKPGLSANRPSNRANGVFYAQACALRLDKEHATSDSHRGA